MPDISHGTWQTCYFQAPETSIIANFTFFCFINKTATPSSKAAGSAPGAGAAGRWLGQGKELHTERKSREETRARKSDLQDMI